MPAKKTSYKDNYYYYSASSAESFTSIPTNRLNVDRLLENKPAWQKPEEARIKKPKILVIDAPYPLWANANEAQIAKERLEALEKEGFKLFFYDSDKLLPLQSHLQRADKPSYVGLLPQPSTNKQVVESVCQQLQCSGDQIHVIDAQGLKELIAGDDSDYTHLLDSHDLNLSQSNISAASLLNLLTLKKNEVTGLDLSGCINLKGLTIPKDWSFPQLEAISLHEGERVAALSKETLLQLISQAENLKHLLLQKKIDPTDLCKAIKHPELLETLELYARNSTLSLPFLAQAKNIKSLYLDANQIDLSSIEHPEQLEVLRLVGQVDGNQLQTILQKASKLQVLDLSRCVWDNSIDVFSALPHLTELKEVVLSGIKSNHLESFLDNNPQLERLTLSQCQQISPEVLQKTRGLKLLSLVNAPITAKELSSILKNNPSLEQLWLSMCSNLNNGIQDEFTLPKLKSLTMYDCQINAQLLSSILSSAPMLQTLNVIKGQIEGELQPAQLTHLKHVKLDGLPGATFIGSLLHNSSIKRLNAYGSDTILIAGNAHSYLVDIPHEIDLSHVEATELALDTLQLSTSSLANLLKKASTIKILRISSSNLSQDVVDSKVCLDSLEEIEIVDTDFHSLLQLLNQAPKLKKATLKEVDVSPQDLAGLINRAESVKEIVLHQTKFIDYVEGSLVQMPSLEKISIQCRENISVKTLQALLQSAPNLRELNFQGNLHPLPPPNEALNLAGVKKLNFNLQNAEELNYFLANARHLEVLNINVALGVLPKSIEHQAPYALDSLKELTLNGYPGDRRGQLLKQLGSLPQLKKLHIIGDDLDLIGHLQKCHCPQLEEITFTGKLNEEQIAVLKNHFPRLRMIFAERLVVPVLDVKPVEEKHQARSSGAKNAFVDADTTLNEHKTFNVTQVLYGYDDAPPINYYRRQVFQALKTNPHPCTINTAFLLGNDNKSELVKREPPRREYDTYNTFASLKQKNKLPEQKSHNLYGRETLLVGKEWVALTSWSAQEKLLEYHLDKNVDIEWAYSKRDNLYYIRHKGDVPTELTIDYVLEVPREDKLESHARFSEDIVAKIKECTEYGDKALAHLVPNMTGQDYLHALQTQKMGACRHRSIIFKEWMQTHHPEIPVRVIMNDCHAFVELKQGDAWVSYDLGGYPAQLNISSGFAKPEVAEEQLSEVEELAVPQSQDAEEVLLEPNAEDAAVQEFYQQLDALKALEKPQELVQAELSASGTVRIPTKVKNYFPQSAPKLYKNPLAYVQDTVSNGGKKQLLWTNSAEGSNRLSDALSAYCQHTSRPYFVVNKPEDLICSAAYIKKEGDKGHMVNGPGGPLHDFLMQHQDQAPVIVVNYDNFSAMDVVRFNSLLDEQRHADGTALPQQATVIGLQNPKRIGAYDGADFYSRFDAPPAPCPFSEHAFSVPSIDCKTLNSIDTTGTYVIDFIGGQNWEERLLGYWDLQGTELVYVEGELQKALASPKPIELRNAPWNDEDFQRVWRSAHLQGRVTWRYGDLELPKTQRFFRSEGYDWASLLKPVNYPQTQSANTLVLNPSVLADFLSPYHCDDAQGVLSRKAGLIEEHKGASMDVHLTRDLSPESWVKLLQRCHQHQVHLRLTVDEGVNLPKDFPSGVTSIAPRAQHVWDKTRIPSEDLAITSTDRDVSAAFIQDAWVLDVSEMDAANLLGKIDARFNPDTLKFQFNNQTGALVKALAEGKRVVLTGHFNAELKDRLQDLLHKRQQELAPGQLIILDADSTSWPVQHYSHTVTTEEKQTLLGEARPDLDLKQPLVHLRAMQAHQSPEKPWLGLLDLPLSLPNPLDEVLKDSAQKSQAFNEKRLQDVEAVLDKSPFVFIAGKSGAGKTTFIQEVLAKKHPNVHMGEEAMLAWAKDQKEGLKVLFIDEANIGSRQWSEFEGLYRPPPAILIGNQWIELSPEHKVVFAGNPLSYGGERELPSLFARHGNSVIFEPLPSYYLYERLLTPIIQAGGLGEQAKTLAQPLLAMAQFLSRCSPTEVLISPRELSMMALLTISYCKRYPEADATKVAEYYTYRLGKNLVPDKYQEAFTNAFKQPEPLSRAQDKIPQNYQLNANNAGVLEALNDALELRLMRTKGLDVSGGLGGVIIEGEPGLGKSELMFQLLQEHGCPYYVMPVSMSLTDKKALMLKAFDEGAVLVVDEINSGPMMERLLNDLLMGRTPEGKKPSHPGFTVIGTQNPASMSGRQQASIALQRRLRTETLEAYEPEQMQRILEQKGLPPKIAKEMVTQYVDIRTREPERNLCFRDLIKRSHDEAESVKSALKAQMGAVQSQFNELLKELQKERYELIAKEMQNKGYKEAQQSAKQLCAALDKAGYLFFCKEPLSTESMIKFDTRVKTAINEAKTELVKHRDTWHKIHPILKGILGITLGIISLGLLGIPALVIHKQTKQGYAGTFFKTPDTNSVAKLDTFDKGMKSAIRELRKQFSLDEDEPSDKQNPGGSMGV